MVTLLSTKNEMPDPDLWKDIQRLDDLYEEFYLDELQFTHDGEKIIYKQNSETAEKLNGRAAMVGFIAAVGSYLATGQVIPGIW